MTLFGKARTAQTFEKITRQHETDISNLYALVNRRYTPSVTQSVIIKGQAASIGSLGAGRLKTAGDTMVGPIALNRKFVTLVSNQIDVGSGSVDVAGDSSFCSYLRLTPGGG